MRNLREDFRTLAAPFDLVYANSQKAFMVSACCLPRNKRLIWHLRDVLSPEHFSLTLRRAATLASTQATVVIANSHATKKAFVSAGGREKKCVVVHNGIDPEPFISVKKDEIVSLRKDLSLNGKFVVGSFGRLTSWKGQHVLLDAIKDLPQVHALIVGGALFGETAYEKNLRDKVRTLGIGDRVSFLGFRKDVPLLMSACDVVAHTATSPEAFGRVLVEGMLSNSVVIASNAGGTSEIVTSGVEGFLIEPGVPVVLGKTIQRVLRDPEGMRALRQRGREKALDTFSVTALVNKVEQIVGALA